MLNVPASPNPGTSLIEILALVILVSGVLLALLALPSFRDGVTGRIKEAKEYLLNQETNHVADKVEINTDSKERREIVDFDLAIFEQN